MNPRWLVRAKRLVQNPPSEKQVMLVFGVILLCIILFGVERLVGWPDWLTPNDMRRGLN